MHTYTECTDDDKQLLMTGLLHEALYIHGKYPHLWLLKFGP